MPLLIEVTDPDPQFPLNHGVSAYVYIKLSDALNHYDQYGIIKVNTFQTFYVTICMFLVNFIFGPPFITQLLPILELVLLLLEAHPVICARQQIVTLFVTIAVIWYICVNLVVNHNLYNNSKCLLLSLLYWIGRKVPLFAGIALICYLLGIVFSPLKVSGNFSVYYNLIVMSLIYLLVVIAAMNLFPRVYYNRIWVRAVYLSLQELVVIQRTPTLAKLIS